MIPSPMPRRPPIDEDPSPEDLERFGGVTRQCPQCNTELYDEAELCWKCGHALSNQTAVPPKWVWITALILLAAFLFFLFR